MVKVVYVDDETHNVLTKLKSSRPGHSYNDIISKLLMFFVSNIEHSSGSLLPSSTAWNTIESEVESKDETKVDN